MTQQAVVGVPVDWEVQLAAGVDPVKAAGIVASQPGVVSTVPVFYGLTTGLQATAGGTTQTTGPGRVLGLPPLYSATFPGEIRYLVGARHGVLLAQQTAANLHATVGTAVRVGLPGGTSAVVRVQGIVDLPSADSLFQAVGAPPGSSLQAPPDNVVLMPAVTWRRIYRPISTSVPGAAGAHLHVNLSSDLPPDPAAALTQVLERAHNLEAKLTGGGIVGTTSAPSWMPRARTRSTPICCSFSSACRAPSWPCS